MEFPFTQETVERLLEESSLADVVRIRPSYTGRGYVPAGIGFELPDTRTLVALWCVFAGNTEAEGIELDDLTDAIHKQQQDNMGHDLIVYYPGVTFPEAEHDCHNSRTNCVGAGCANDE